MEALAAPDQSWHQGCVSAESGSVRSVPAFEGEAPLDGVARGVPFRSIAKLQHPIAASHPRPSIGTGGWVSGADGFSTWGQSLMAMT